MCLITEQTKAIKICKDRTVYKVMNGVSDLYAWSKHQEGFSYTFGQLNETEIKRTDERTIFDEVASNAYGAGWITNEELISYGEGFHSIKSLNRVFSEVIEGSFSLGHAIRCRCIVECTIPKGSLIYEDKTGLLISNQIIINREVMKAELYKHFDVPEPYFETTGTHTWSGTSTNVTSGMSNNTTGTSTVW